MAIVWQARGEGQHAHRFYAVTRKQSDVLDAPTAPGVHELEVDGVAVFAIAVPTPRLLGRPLRWGPAVYETREDAEAHAEAWLTRDRDAFYGEG